MCIHFWNSSYHCTILILNLCKLHYVIALVSPATTSHKKVLTKWMRSIHCILYNRPKSFCLSTPCNQCNVPFLLDLVNQWWVLLPWFDFHNFSSICLAMIDCWPQTNPLRLIAHSIFSFVFIIFRHWLIVFLPVSLFRLQSGLSAGITETAYTSVGKPDWQPEAPGPGVGCHLL